MDRIIDHISQMLPDISSAEEAGAEFEDLKGFTSCNDAAFLQKEFLEEPGAWERLQWSLILKLV